MEDLIGTSERPTKFSYLPLILQLNPHQFQCTICETISSTACVTTASRLSRLNLLSSTMFSNAAQQEYPKDNQRGWTRDLVSTLSPAWWWPAGRRLNVVITWLSWFFKRNKIHHSDLKECFHKDEWKLFFRALNTIIDQNSYLVQRLGEMKQKICNIHCWALRRVLLFYSPSIDAKSIF